MLGNYLVAHYGSATTTITEEQVTEVRRGGPVSPLLMLARGGMASAVIVLLGILVIVKRPKTFSSYIGRQA